MTLSGLWRNWLLSAAVGGGLAFAGPALVMSHAARCAAQDEEESSTEETSEEAETEEPTEAPADEPSEEPAEEPSEAPADEPADAPEEAPADEPTDEPAEEKPADEPTEEPGDEKPAEEPADDKPADEKPEEPADEPSDEKPADEKPEDEPSDEKPAPEEPEPENEDDPKPAPRPRTPAPAPEEPAPEEPAPTAEAMFDVAPATLAKVKAELKKLNLGPGVSVTAVEEVVNEQGESLLVLTGQAATLGFKDAAQTAAQDRAKEVVKAEGDEEAHTPNVSTDGLAIETPKKLLDALNAAVKKTTFAPGVEVARVASEANEQGEVRLVVQGRIVEDSQAEAVVALIAEKLAELLAVEETDLLVTGEGLSTSQKFVLAPEVKKEMVANLNAEIEADGRLDGCHLSDIRSEVSDQGADVLKLRGRIGKEEQREILRDVAERKAIAGVRLQFSADDLVKVNPNPAAARHFFDQGVVHYTKGAATNDIEQYRKSLESFRRAILEDPKQLHYKYWRVVVEIAMGDLSRAQAHVSTLVKLRQGDLYPDDYVDTLWSLERVQGPVRQKLRKLEEDALLDE